MFVWAPIPAKYAKSMDFCLDLVEKSGVLCTPGSSFGPLGEGYVRFALTLPPERIAEAVNSIKEKRYPELKITGTSIRRSRYFYAFTIFSPVPSSHVRRLLAVISISRCRASLVAHAMCGVSRAFGRPRKGACLRQRFSAKGIGTVKAKLPVFQRIGHGLLVHQRTARSIQQDHAGLCLWQGWPR